MHNCEGKLLDRSYGAAIEYCIEADGKLWAGNGEYESEVKFCPYCGFTMAPAAETGITGTRI